MKNPLAGLLLYLYYIAGTKLSILFLQSMVWGIIYLATANMWVHMIFGFNAVAGAAFLLLTGMGANREINWERYQLCMPITRRHVAISQYLSVAIASFIGVPIYLIVTGVGLILHESAYFTFVTLAASIAPFLAIPFILAGLCYPLMCIRSIEDKQDGIFPLLMIASVAIPQLVAWGAYRLEWPVNMAVFITLAAAMAIFIVSYFITKMLYAKIDF